jgi:hypothetical protein
MANKRVNISIPEALHEILKDLSDKYYEGNFSRFLTDAGLYYAGVLDKREENNSENVDNV